MFCKKFVLIFLTLALFLIPASGQSAPLPEGYRWEKNPSYTQFDLYFRDSHVGGVNPKGEFYWHPAPGQWVRAECPFDFPEGVQKPATSAHVQGDCPCGPACPCGPDCQCGKGKLRPQTEDNYGVDPSKIHGGEHHINGRSVTRDEILSAIKDVPHDKDKLRLTLIAPDPASLSPGLSSFSQEKGLLFQAYTPDHWAVKGLGFKTDKAPVVYLQRPDGKVLLRLDSFSGDTSPLTAAIREANPSYDPSKDPNGTPDIWEKIKALPKEIWAVILFFVYLFGRKEQ